MTATRGRDPLAGTIVLAMVALCGLSGVAYLLSRLAREMSEHESVLRSDARSFWQAGLLLASADASCQEALRPGRAGRAEECLSLIDAARSTLAGEKNEAFIRLGAPTGALEALARDAESVHASLARSDAPSAVRAADRLHDGIAGLAESLAREESRIWAEESAKYALQVDRAQGYTRLLSLTIGLLVIAACGVVPFLAWRRAALARLAHYEGEIAVREKYIMATKERIDLGVMAAGVAHEINNPLSAILGFSQMLRLAVDKGGVVDERMREYARRIETQAERVALVTQGLCALRDSQPSEEATTSDVRLVAELAVDLVGARFESLGILLETDFPQQPCHAGCVESDLFHVVHNLLSSAADAIVACDARAPGASPGGASGVPPGSVPGGGSVGGDGMHDDRPRVLLRVRRSGGAVRLEVSNDAPGLAPGDRERLFVPFFAAGEFSGGVARVDGICGGARGLGLTVANSLVARYGGRLYLDPARGGMCLVVEFEAA